MRCWVAKPSRSGTENFCLKESLALPVSAMPTRARTAQKTMTARWWDRTQRVRLVMPGYASRVQPIVVTTSSAHPREEVFAFLDVMANHEPFTNHMLVDWS